MAEDVDWPEDEYQAYLHGERESYAWVMRKYGGMTSEQARDEALNAYPYEPPGTSFRGIAFHDLAWHWAMLRLKGDQYWQRHPDLAKPPAAYQTLD